MKSVTSTTIRRFAVPEYLVSSLQGSSDEDFNVFQRPVEAERIGDVGALTEDPTLRQLVHRDSTRDRRNHEPMHNNWVTDSREHQVRPSGVPHSFDFFIPPNPALWLSET